MTTDQIKEPLVATVCQGPVKNSGSPWHSKPSRYSVSCYNNIDVNYCPQTKFAKVMFLHLSVSHSFHRGECVVAGGRARLWGAACVVARACVVVGVVGGMCMVVGGSCIVAGGPYVGYDEIWSMSGRYASYWNAFLLILKRWHQIP